MMRRGCFLLVVFSANSAVSADHVALYRCYDTEKHQSQYTTSSGELRRWREDPKLSEKGIIGWVPSGPGEGVVRLYRALSKKNNRTYYYRVKPRTLTDFELVGPPIYVYECRQAGLVPVHACCLSGGEDMHFSQSRDEIKEVVETTLNGIGNRRLVFHNAFYVLPVDPSKKEGDESDAATPSES